MKSKYAGKKLRKKVKTNPRRKGSHGAKHWGLYRNGLQYEELSAKKNFGYHHLRWDLQHGYIEFR